MLIQGQATSGEHLRLPAFFVRIAGLMLWLIFSRFKVAILSAISWDGCCKPFSAAGSIWINNGASSKCVVKGHTVKY
jgi:hypothetical protein